MALLDRAHGERVLPIVATPSQSLLDTRHRRWHAAPHFRIPRSVEMRIIMITIVLAVSAMVANVAAAAAPAVLITGCDRGIGLEFARQYAEKDWSVIATALNPETASSLKELAGNHRNIVVEKLDVTSDADIRAIARKYAGKPIDVLINNAGILGGRAQQTLGTFDRKAFHDVLDVNTFGALAVAEALRESVALSKRKKIIAITSDIGSITNAESFPKDTYNYRISKAALDMGMRVLGIELRTEGVTVALVTPGAVKTEMLSTYAKEWNSAEEIPAITATEAVGKMIPLIEKLNPEKAEKGIVDYDGKIIPW
jgi:NAD(P)-dependent dehydrogenase (short-subunit alcohol dehydrogenase family)